MVAAVLTITFTFVLFSGKKIYLKPEDKSYPTGTTSIEATFKNILPRQYFTSHKYTLEKLVGEEWTKVERDQRGAFFEDDGFPLSMALKSHLI